MFKFPKCKMFLIMSNAIHTIFSCFGQENSHGVLDKKTLTDPNSSQVASTNPANNSLSIGYVSTKQTLN